VLPHISDPRSYEPSVNERSAEDLIESIPPDAFDMLREATPAEARLLVATHFLGATEATINDILAELSLD